MLVLDDDRRPAFGTSRCLLKQNAIDGPEQLRIVQWDEEKAARMRSHAKHPALGQRVACADVGEYLASAEREPYFRGVYLDVCGTIATHILPALHALLTHPAQRASGPCVIGVTWCTRDPRGHTSDASECELLRTLMRHGSATMITEGSFEQMRTRFYLWKPPQREG